jgi:hypothetical protein
MTFKRKVVNHFMTAQSMTSSFNSVAIPINLMDDVGIQTNVTNGSSAVGTLSIQVSADHLQDDEGNILVAGTWATVQSPPGTNLTLAVTGNGAYYFDLALLSAPYCRLAYTATSGTGTADGWVAAKAI